MDIFMDVIFIVLLVVLGVSIFHLMDAAERLKPYEADDPDAYEARYHSKPTVAAVVVLGIASYFSAEDFLNSSSVNWLSYVLAILAGIIILAWWFLHRPTVVRYAKRRSRLRKRAKEKQSS